MDDRKLVLVPIVLVILFGATLLAQERLPYQDPKLPVEQRVTDLLKRMTLEEKIAQLEGSWQNRDNVKDPQALFVDEKGNFLPAHPGATSNPRALRIVGLLRSLRHPARFVDFLQGQSLLAAPSADSAYFRLG